MITYRDWFIFLAGARILLAEPAVFSFRLDKSQIQVGETATLTLQIPHLNRSDRPIVNDELYNAHPSLKPLATTLQKDNLYFNLTFEFTAYKANDYRIPPIQVKWGPDSYSSEALPLSVITTRKSEDSEIRPDFSSLPMPFPWSKAYRVLIGTLSLGIVFWLVRRLIQKAPWKALFRFYNHLKIPSFETDRAWLKKELRRIQNQISLVPDYPQAVDDVFQTLTLFLKRKTGSPVPAWTSTEIRNQVPQKLLKKEVLSLFHTTDLFRYGATTKENSKLLATRLISAIEKEYL